MNVTCPECQSIFRVDPARVPGGGIAARCSVCGGVMLVVATGDSVGAPGPAGDQAAADDASLRGAPVGAAAAASSPTPSTDDRTATETFVGAVPGTTASAPAPAARGTEEEPARPAASAGPSYVSGPGGPPAVVADFGVRTPTAGEAPTAVTRTGAPASAIGAGAPVATADEDALPRPAAVDAAPPAADRAPDRGSGEAALAPAEPSRPGRDAVSAAVSSANGGQPPRPFNPYLSADPNQKARRLARALVSDLVAYNPQKREEGLRTGSLKALFREEIRKSWDEYVEQVGAELAESTTHFQDALNDVLAGGRKVF